MNGNSTMIKITAWAAATAICLSSCSGGKDRYDASGTFEATETIVPAEATGTIRQLDIEEGQTLRAGQQVGYIDSLQLYLKRQQLEAQIAAVLSKAPDAAAQLATLQEQLKHAELEEQRLSRLFEADAATRQQLDNAVAQTAIIRKQIAAQRSSLNITTASLKEETAPLQLQIAQLEDQLAKCKIVNPVNGTVLVKYAMVNEMAVTGKPLYQIADLSSIVLRAYVTGSQFDKVKVGQQVQVLADDGNGGYKTYTGTVTWISDKAEFTPKTIQTKDERASLVYATKITVKNDGYLKIGMYGEVKF